jgi:hypothetical protein
MVIPVIHDLALPNSFTTRRCARPGSVNSLNLARTDSREDSQQNRPSEPRAWPAAWGLCAAVIARGAPRIRAERELHPDFLRCIATQQRAGS